LAFAFLVVNRHRPAPRDELAEVLWPGNLPRAWEGAVNALMSKLRALFSASGLDGATAVEWRSGCYQLHLPPDAVVDVEEAAAAVDRADAALARGDTDSATEDACRAVELARGTFLPGDEGPWVDVVRAGQRRLLVRALDAGIRAAHDSGDPARAATLAEEAVALEPFRETGHQQLIQALAAAGDRARALRAYEYCRRVLTEELGIDPSPQTEAAYLEVLRADLPGGPPITPPLPPLVAARAGMVFVGRDAELDQLRRHLATVRPGDARLVIVAGEPGIGKTALATRFAALAHREGASVLLGRCDEETRPPYQPFVEALRHVIADLPTSELRSHLRRDSSNLLRLVPSLADRLPGLSEPAPGDPDTERYRLFEAVAGFLTSLSAAHPLLLVLEDLHWADPPSLLLLRHLARYSDGLQLLTVGTCRSSELGRGHPLSEAVADLRRDDLVAELPLAGLDENEVAALVAAAGNTRPALAGAISRASDGNPLYVREIVRHLAETGTEEVRIPTSVKDVISHRLARLPEHTLAALALAAVVGREFGLDLLGRVSGESDADLLEDLEPAAAAGIVAEVPEAVDRWAFSHFLVRETLSGTMSTSRRVRLHCRIGEALEALAGGEPRTDAADLAYHFWGAGPAGDPGKAVRYGRLAGDQAMAQLAFENAVAHYERALQSLDRIPGSDDDDLRGALLLGLGDAKASAGDAGARDTYLAAADLARRGQNAPALAAAALGVADMWARSGTVDQVRIDLLEEALATLADADSPLRARLLGRLATELSSVPGSLPRRQALTADSVEVARRLGDPVVLASCLHCRNHAVWGPGGAEERLAAGREIVGLAERGGDRELALQGHAWCETALLELGEVAGLDAELAAYDRLAEELGQPRYRWYAATRRAMRTLLTGDLDAGERMAREALAMGRRAAEPDAEDVFACQMGMVWHERPAEEPSHLWADLSPRYEGLPQDSARVMAWHGHHIRIALEAGHDEEARAELEWFRAIGLDEVEKTVFWTPPIAFLSAAVAQLGTTEEQRMLYALLVPYAAGNVLCGGAVSFWGSCSHHLGVLAASLGDWHNAERHLTHAAAAHERMGARAHLARTRLESASMFTARGRPDDAEQARALVDLVDNDAGQLGLPVVARRVVELRARLDAQR
jgi:DNA-binding SARP family transcriptional activator